MYSKEPSQEYLTLSFYESGRLFQNLRIISFSEEMKMPWGTPTLTGYSWEVFQPRTKRSHLLLRKEKIRPNIRPEIPYNLSLWRRPACQILKSLGYITCYSSSSPRPIKSPCNSIRYNCQKICSWSRRPKTILEMRKKPCFSRWSTILIFTSFSKTLLTTERRITGR